MSKKLAYNSGRYPTKVNHVRVNAYEIWRHMVIRCGHTRYDLTERYADVFVCDRWLDYSNFFEDVSKMIGYNVKGFELDKDLLSNGEKVYSLETCCFIPQHLNAALTKSDKSRGRYPVGVDFHKKTGKFRARHQIHIGLFDTEIEAFNAYKQAKESYLKELAVKWKDQIDTRAYEALMKYEVNIDD